MTYKGRGFSIYPSYDTACGLNKTMHAELLDSLIHIREHGNFGSKTNDDLFSLLITGISQGQSYPPFVFGLYYRMTFALLQERTEVAQAYMQRLANAIPEQDKAIDIYALDHPYIAPYRDVYMDSLGEHKGFILQSASEEDVQNFLLSYKVVMDILKNFLPELYAEISVLLRQIILVTDHEDARVSFNGMAPYQLWRLLFLNAKPAGDPAVFLETLIHETAHIRLFGHTIYEPLTLNPPDEMVFSPIRNEERPIDGIFHAMFVTARVAHAFQTIHEQIEPDNCVFTQLDGQYRKNLRIFQECHSIILRSARLSQTGYDILKGIDALMQK